MRPALHFDGQSLPSLMRSVIASPLANGQKNQKPIVRWAKHDGPRLRSAECVTRWMKVFRRRQA